MRRNRLNPGFTIRDDLEWIAELAAERRFETAERILMRLRQNLQIIAERPGPRPDKGALNSQTPTHPYRERAMMVSNKVPELQRALQDKNTGRVAYIVEQCLSAWEGKEGGPEA